jgi:hypothetical protein
MPSIAAALVVGPAAFALLTFAPVPRMMAIAAAMVLAGAAACSGPSLAAIVRGRRAGRASQVRSVLRMIELSASVDDLLLVLLVLVAFPLFRGDFGVAATVFAAGVVGGAAFGGVTWLFLGGTAGEDERLLLGLAMLAVIAGFAEWLSLSPAGVAATSAAVLVNLPGERMSRLVSAVKRVERPAVVILMTMIGLRITGDLSWIFAPLVVLFTLVRVAVKAWAGAWLQGAAPGVRSTRRWGLGLAPMGTLGMVVVLGVSQAWQHELARTLLAAAAAASLLSEIIAPWLMLRLLRTIGMSAARSTAA